MNFPINSGILPGINQNRMTTERPNPPPGLEPNKVKTTKDDKWDPWNDQNQKQQQLSQQQQQLSQQQQQLSQQQQQQKSEQAQQPKRVSLNDILPVPLEALDSVGKGITGLRNLGMTCYLNSSLQCLSHTIPLTEYLLTGKFRNYLAQHLKDEKLVLIVHYLNLLSEMWEKNRVLVPKTFTKYFIHLFPEGGIFRQNDSQETVIFLLDTFHELISRKVTYNISGKPQNEFDRMMLTSIKEWGEHYKNTHSFILDLFSGQEHERLQCANCEKITHKFPPFMYTCLPINSKTKTIYDCFDRHCKTEQFDEDNQRECEDCGQKTRAYRKTAYWKLPQVLIISLKRFQFRELFGQYQEIKKNNLIEYPVLNLDLSDYVTNPEDSSTYNLYAVCCHEGSVNFGHYYSYCLNSNGIWYEYNDELVSEITNIVDIITQDAYMLFYYKA